MRKFRDGARRTKALITIDPVCRDTIVRSTTGISDATFRNRRQCTVEAGAVAANKTCLASDLVVTFEFRKQTDDDERAGEDRVS